VRGAAQQPVLRFHGESRFKTLRKVKGFAISDIYTGYDSMRDGCVMSTASLPPPSGGPLRC
jgi:hypothetical protein